MVAWRRVVAPALVLSAALTAPALTAPAPAPALALAPGPGWSAAAVALFGAPQRPQWVRAVASPTETAATVTWQAARRGPPASWFVISEYHQGRYLASRTCFAPCAGVTARGLDPAGPGWVFEVNAGNAAGQELVPAVSPPISISSGCATGAVCLEVSDAADGGSARLRAQGFLSGIGAPAGSPGPYARLVSALEPRWWRVHADDGPDNINVSASYGAKVTVVLSDAWKQSHLDATGGAKPPWSDWAGYRAWVTAYVRAIEATRGHVQYWDIQNEPGLRSGYYSPTDSQTVTTARLLQQVLVAYQAVKAADPRAAVLGPSLAQFADHPGEVHDQQPDLRTLLDFCLAHHIRLAAISWHEINDVPGRTDFDASPETIVAHVASARALLAARPALGSPAIVINEYGAGDVRLAPGWQVGYFSAIERADVDEANRTCSPDLPGILDACNGPNLDGLLTPSGEQTRAGYWVSAFYAQMSGHRTPVTTSDEGVTGFATVGGDGVMRVLLGRHASCPDALSAFCLEPPGLTPLPESVVATVAVPATAGPVEVAIQRIPDESGVVAPEPVSDQTMAATAGSVHLRFPTVYNGDAYTVTVTPARPVPTGR